MTTFDDLPVFPGLSILTDDDGDMADLQALSLLALAASHPGTQLLPTTYCLYRQAVDVTGVHAMQILRSWPADPFGDAREALDKWKAAS
jgi:hypothetical protein